MTTAPPVTTPAHAHASLPARVALALGDIKLAHSVFALPFAVLGAFLAAPASADDPGRTDWAAFAVTLALVVACMFFARTWAMLVNRVADARLDAANPRTARRAFAAGRLSRRDAHAMLAACAAAFTACCAAFGFLQHNWWPLALAAPVLAWIALYSFTKRFTFLCHLFLGSALAASPIAAAIATDGLTPFTTPTPAGLAVLALSAMVVCWVAGFDVIYALQDLDHDRSASLHSVPARFGWRRAIWISRVLHALCLAALAAAWRVEPRLGTLFLAAIALVLAALVAEHAVLARRGKAGIPMAFFTLNGLISCSLGLLGVLDVLL